MGILAGLFFWMTKREPTTFEITAVIIKLLNAALKTPEIIGMLVFSETSSSTFSISSFDRAIEESWSIPDLFTMTCFDGPGHSMLKTAGSLRIGVRLDKPTIFACGGVFSFSWEPIVRSCGFCFGGGGILIIGGGVFTGFWNVVFGGLSPILLTC